MNSKFTELSKAIEKKMAQEQAKEKAFETLTGTLRELCTNLQKNSDQLEKLRTEGIKRSTRVSSTGHGEPKLRKSFQKAKLFDTDEINDEVKKHEPSKLI